MTGRQEESLSLAGSCNTIPVPSSPWSGHYTHCASLAFFSHPVPVIAFYLSSSLSFSYFIIISFLPFSVSSHIRLRSSRFMSYILSRPFSIFLPILFLSLFSSYISSSFNSTYLPFVQLFFAYFLSIPSTFSFLPPLPIVFVRSFIIVFPSSVLPFYILYIYIYIFLVSTFIPCSAVSRCPVLPHVISGQKHGFRLLPALCSLSLKLAARNLIYKGNDATRVWNQFHGSIPDAGSIYLPWHKSIPYVIRCSISKSKHWVHSLFHKELWLDSMCFPVLFMILLRWPKPNKNEWAWWMNE